MKKKRIFPALMLSSVVLLTSAASGWAGPKTVVGTGVAANQRVSMDKIDHAVLDSLLQKYVDDRGDVDYSRWKRTTADIQQLARYLNTLSRADRNLSASKDARLAFWINAYNAVTLHGILREYPTSSIRNHTAKLYGYNIWKDLLLQVGDIQISLDDMEHKVLRKMGEPRIHFAIVCASKGCPKLANRAYLAALLEEQLARNTRDFFANRNNFRYDAEKNRFYLSSILDWFGEDFGRTSADQLRTIAAYLPDRASVQAAKSGRVRVSYLDYDWSLNDQAKRRTVRR